MSVTPRITRFVVAIHGIGNQRRCETIRSAANQFADFINPGSPVQPLGHYNLGGDGHVVVSRVAGLPSMGGDIGVAEVYWADVPRDLARRGDTLDESKAWARTVAARAQKLYQDNVYPNVAKTRNAGQRDELRDQKEQDFKQASGVIEEIVEGVAVLENLMFLAGKAGIAQFDLGALLADYIGGIQLVADFAFYRNEIVGRFHDAMIEIVKQSSEYCDLDELQIYLVAHSEGTVVTLAALLEALLPLAQRRRTGASRTDMRWIRYVRGLMTIGSPLDKHVLLWPNLWTDIGLASPEDILSGRHGTPGNFHIPPAKIRWYNYYDLGDPVAYDVSETRRYIEGLGCQEAFQWRDSESQIADYGFSRYLWPGYAHVEYWTDEGVFRHFIRNVAFEGQGSEPAVLPPASRPCIKLACSAISFAIPFLLQFVAVAVLVGTLNPFIDTTYELSLLRCVVIVLGMGCQLSALCVAARLPRLGGSTERRFPVFCLALAIFAIGAVVGALSLWPSWAKELSTALHFDWRVNDFLDQVPQGVSRFWYIPPAFGLVAILMCWWPRGLPPKKRMHRAGRTILVGWVALMAVIMVTITLFAIGPQPGQSFLTPTLGLLAFVYLWWVGVVLFDLAYIWHRYIRNSRVVEVLRTWMNDKRDMA